MAQAKKTRAPKVLTPEQQLKKLTKERADIVATLERIKLRSEREAARAVQQTTNYTAMLADVDAKIAALGTPEVAS